MKSEVKYSAVGSSSTSSVAGDLITKVWSPKLPPHFNAGLVTVAVVSFMIVLQVRDTLKSGLFDDFKRMIHPLDPPEEVEMPQRWNYSSHEFLPIISAWDEERVRWIEADPNLKIPDGARPRVLMVTGSSQEEGELYILSHLLLRAGKNKQDYTQMHDMDLYYNMVNPDPEFSDWWVKLPVVRMLMLRHPEVEWIWWLDADAVITEMTFEPPFAKLDHYNLILYGEDHLVHDSLDPAGLSTGAFMLRNCQWSLDLLGAWAFTGTDSKREEAANAKMQEELEANRTTVNVVQGDDRSSLVALLVEDKRNPIDQQKWVPKVKLVEDDEYTLNGNWTHVAPMLEELSQDKEHGVPFVTHFDGCLPHPSEVPQLSRQDSELFSYCVEQLERAFDFAENQVYKELGLERNAIGNSSEPFFWKDTDKEELPEDKFRILPVVTGWDEKRKAYMESNPWTKRDDAVILSGSPPTPCTEKEGSHILVRGLKNKIDYSRIHGIRIFYNMAVIHTNLTGWWSKLPAVKLMMINSVDVEWIWWTDSDAAFTSMDFKIPFERYNAEGLNVVMWGNEHQSFDLKDFRGINTGNMFIRNCQWSLDLLDRWAALANTTEEFLDSYFTERPRGWATDDQSTLMYLLITEREKWASKVHFEHEFVMSGNWEYWTRLFVDEYKMRADRRPLMTHFAGCHPCSIWGVGTDQCLEMYDRAYNFADNQVLENFGLRHERLNSSRIVGDYLGDAQEWTHDEIERLVDGKSPEELPAEAKHEEEVTSSTETEEVPTSKEGEAQGQPEVPETTGGEQVQEPSKEEEQKVEPASEHEKEPSTTDEPAQEHQEEPSTTEEQSKGQEEVTSSKEEEKVDPGNVQEEQPKTEEEEKKEQQQEVTTTTTEEELTTKQEVEPTQEENVDWPKESSEPGNENQEAPQEENVDRPTESSEPGNENQEAPKTENVDWPKESSEPGNEDHEAPKDENVDRPTESSDPGNDNPEAPKEVEVPPTTNKEEKVDIPQDEPQVGNENPEAPKEQEQAAQTQDSESTQREEVQDNPSEGLSNPAKEESTTLADP